MWVYFLVPGIWHEIEESEAAGHFLDWLTADESGVLTELVRKFLATSESLGGLGGTVESEDDLDGLVLRILDRIAVIK